jgi:hypothetical protein
MLRHSIFLVISAELKIMHHRASICPFQKKLKLFPTTNYIHGSPLQSPTITEPTNHHDIDIQDQMEALRITPSTLKQASTPKQSTAPQVILVDNQGAIKLSKNPQHHNRTKHIDIKYHFVRDSYQKGLIELIHIPTSEMVADILTKALPRDKHEKLAA